jgi:hypothetical protein
MVHLTEHSPAKINISDIIDKRKRYYQHALNITNKHALDTYCNLFERGLEESGYKNFNIDLAYHSHEGDSIVRGDDHIIMQKLDNNHPETMGASLEACNQFKKLIKEKYDIKMNLECRYVPLSSNFEVFMDKYRVMIKSTSSD